MGPEGLVPSLLVYVVVPSFPAVNTQLPKQKEKMEALSLARWEMATITAKLRIQRALRSKLPAATEYDVSPGDQVHVFREKDNRWHGPYEVTKRREKEVFLKIDGREAQINPSQVLPNHSKVTDAELERLHEAIGDFKSNPPPGIFITEVLSPSDQRGDSPLFDAAKIKELAGLAKRGVYEIVWKEDVPTNANILGGRFVLSIKNKEHARKFTKPGLWSRVTQMQRRSYLCIQHHPWAELCTPTVVTCSDIWFPNLVTGCLSGLIAVCCDIDERSLCTPCKNVLPTVPWTGWLGDCKAYIIRYFNTPPRFGVTKRVTGSANSH